MTTSSEMQRLVQQIYAVVLDRSAGADEVAFWAVPMEAGRLNVAKFVGHILGSPEAVEVKRRREVERKATGTTISREEAEALVAKLYLMAFDRDPNVDEVSFWTECVLDRGMSAHELVGHIAESPEAVAVRAARQAVKEGGGGGAAAVPSEIEALVVLVYQWALRRTPGDDERNFWAGQILTGQLSPAKFAKSLADSDEALAIRRSTRVLPKVPNGRFIQYAYDQVLGRAPMANEIAYWDHRLVQQGLMREELLTSFFTQQAERHFAEEDQSQRIDPNVAHVMGTADHIKIDEWLERAERLDGQVPALQPRIYPALSLPQTSEILVSIIASLYRGGQYIGRFLENMTTQTIFPNCELIIIDADSPENEYEVIAPYLERFPNIVYRRTETRIGIYDAWNLGAQMARGRYVTNANLDDLRRHDSFERQAEILEKFSFVDIVYQDFFYSFDGQAKFARSAAAGVRSDVPVITPYNLGWSNSPHNAPMWRRSLHDEIGWFDTNYRSAGDYDFWLRCSLAGKTFYKVNDPHVVYYVNPSGISTRPDTRGAIEAQQIMRDHGPKLMSPALLDAEDDFLGRIADIVPDELDLSKADRASPDWRYIAVQRALRGASAAARYAAKA